jgi:hypothetical protein
LQAIKRKAKRVKDGAHSILNSYHLSKLHTLTCFIPFSKIFKTQKCVLSVIQKKGANTPTLYDGCTTFVTWKRLLAHLLQQMFQNVHQARHVELLMGAFFLDRKYGSHNE